MNNTWGPSRIRRISRPTAAPQRESTRESTRLAVLIVDPDWQSAVPLAAALRDIAFVATASTAAEAFGLLQARIPEIIITELDLPDMSGLDLIRALYANEATHHTLTMVLTRRAAMRDKIAAFAAGADHYLVKPVTPEALVQQVRLVSRFRQVIRT